MKRCGIYLIRGRKVILDSEFAELYEAENLRLQNGASS